MVAKVEYWKNPDKYRNKANTEYERTYSSPEKKIKRMLGSISSRAKNRNTEFSITADDLKWNDVCPIFNIPIVVKYGRGSGFHPDSPSIDRIDNSKGYVPGNVRVISAKANVCKNQMTKEECQLLLNNWDKV